MEHFKEAQSRLLIRLAQVISDSEYPVPAWRRRAPGTEEIDSIQEPAWEHLETLRLRFESELTFADSYLAEDPPSPRIQLLLGNSSELRKLAILQRFIERAYSYRLRLPREGLQITDDLIAWTTDPSPLVAILRARALMERGNFLRILGDPDGAYAALAEALTQLEASAPSDPLDLARHQELLGSLERDCGNFEAATDLLGKALYKIRRWGDPYTLQRTLIAAGMAELFNSNFEEAEKLLDEAMRVESPDSFLLRSAAFNRLLAYFLNGSPHKAYQALLRVRGKLGSSWLNDAPEAIEMRALWVEGQILHALQSDDDAIGILRKAREAAIRLDLGCELCHISLDLALVHTTQERFSEVRDELAFALPFCSERRALDVHGKQALLALLGSLQHRGRLEAVQIRGVARQLETLLRAPLQPIQPPYGGLPF
jgi:tetratricopeptide (TPR) repeat protein